MQECLRTEIQARRFDSSSTAPPVLDLETLGALRELLPDPEVYAIYRSFVQHTRERIAALGTSFDPATVKREAHSLRGSAAMLGASALASLAGSLEEHVVTGAPLREHAKDLAEALAALTEALDTAEVRL